MQQNEPKELDNLKKRMLWVGERSLALFAKVTHMATLHFTSSFNCYGFGNTQIVRQRGPGGKALLEHYANSKTNYYFSTEIGIIRTSCDWTLFYITYVKAANHAQGIATNTGRHSSTNVSRLKL